MSGVNWEAPDMNIKEGSRRLAIVLGGLGAIVGAFAGYQTVREVWEARTAQARFESFADSSAIKKDQSDLLDTVRKDWFARNARPQDRKKLATLDESEHGIGVERFTIDSSTGSITSIELSTGELLQNTKKPSRVNYLILPGYLVIGFLVPWCTIRILAWIIAGFSR
jgi:hypothetical protein